MIIVDNFLNITSCSMERMELEPRSYDSKDHDFKKINTIMPVTQVSSFERKTWIHKWKRYTTLTEINLTDIWIISNL